MSNRRIRTGFSIVLMATLVVCTLMTASCGAESTNGSIAAEVKRRIDLWNKYCREQIPRSSDFTGNQYYRDIVDLGVPAAPYLIKEIENGSVFLGDAVTVITKKRFEEYEQAEYNVRDSRSTATAVVKWWARSRKETPRNFSLLYVRWKTLRSQGKREQAKEQLGQMRGLGIAALPIIVQSIERGDRQLIPLVSELTGGATDPNASAAQVASWWGKDKEKWLIPFPNSKPIAKTGPDRTTTAGDVVSLDASASTDPDSDDLSYLWTQVGGPPVVLSDARSAKPTFTAPSVEGRTTLVFQLVVDDAGDLSKALPTPNSRSEPATVRITVEPKN